MQRTWGVEDVGLEAVGQQIRCCDSSFEHVLTIPFQTGWRVVERHDASNTMS